MISNHYNRSAKNQLWLIAHANYRAGSSTLVGSVHCTIKSLPVSGRLSGKLQVSYSLTLTVFHFSGNGQFYP